MNKKELRAEMKRLNRALAGEERRVASERIFAVRIAFQPAVERWSSGSAVPAEPFCLMMVRRPPPSISVTP